MIFTTDLDIHERPIGSFMESPLLSGKLVEKERSLVRNIIKFFSTENMKEETSMGSQGFGGFNKKQLEKLKALLDQMNTLTTISNYVQHGDISQGLIPFSDSYSDPWIIDSRASNHMTGSSHFFFNYIPSVGKKKFL